METHDILDGKKILWVEDDPFLQKIVAKRMSLYNFTLLHAHGGEEAIKIVETEIPDLIMLDVLLPGMDGFEILKRFKEDPKIKDVPAIFLSNLGQQADFDKSKKLGALKFLVKYSLTVDQIIDEIREALRSVKK